MSIPVENIYYLLCYAWSKLDEGALVDVSGVEPGRVADLLARILINGTVMLLRRGLDRGYLIREEDLSTVRGRIQFQRTARRCLQSRARLGCSFDELSYDVLHNRILKTTLRRLAMTTELEDGHRKKLIGLCRRMPDVTEIPLTRKVFRRLQLHRNNAFYSFLMNVCELAMDCLLVDEKAGGYRFRDFLRDEVKMRMVFQHFVFNFYRLEQTEYQPKVDRFKWDAQPCSPDRAADLDYLPMMETDITLRSQTHTLVIDTKYYAETLVGRMGGRTKVRSDNLYQLHAYLTNMEHREGPDGKADGLLLYPDTTGEVDLAYRLRGHVVQIRTINLKQSWDRIHADLLGLIEERSKQSELDKVIGTPWTSCAS